MPSGAKKRKAAKKKLQKEAHLNTESHSQGVNDAKTNDEREESVERVSLEQENGAEKGDSEVKSAEESYKDVAVDANVVDREFGNGKNKGSSSSSSSDSGGSSDDDEVVVEKEKPVEEEVGVVEQQEGRSFKEAAIGGEVLESAENVPGGASVENTVVSEGESIPVEESIKQVVSLPGEASIVAESVSDVLQTPDEKIEVESAVMDSVQEENEEVIPVMEVDDATVGEDESLLPPSFGVEAVNKSYEDENVKESEIQKYVEEQPLLSSAPMPVRRTSWMNCCGLFEVLSGGSSR